jgi:hypothetical protein
MKTKILLLFLLSACLSGASASEIKGKITSYGIFKISGKEEIVKSPETTSGITRIPAGTPTLTTSTDRIPAKIGVRFGMWYEISNLPISDGEVELTKIARHPVVTKPDGSISTGFTFIEKLQVKDGRVIGWTGYGFDHDYELVAGDWEFEMQFKGKTVCKQKFTVFKE